MHATTLLAAALGVAGVNAVIGDLGVPKTIKSGDTFNILGHQTIGQGYGEYMIIFGIQNVDPAKGVYPDSLGAVFAGPYDLNCKSHYQDCPHVTLSTSNKEVYRESELIWGTSLRWQLQLDYPQREAFR